MAHVASAAELLRRIADPAASEACSVLFGEPVVQVDLGVDPPPAARDPRAWERLAELPAPTVGVAMAGVARGARALADALDVVAEGEAELAAILATARKAPLATLVLVQLLRGSLARSVAEGLVAESLAYSTLQAGPEFAAFAAGRTGRAREPSREPAVLVTRSGDRLELRLNRPEKRNAFSAEMRDALCEALALVVQDASVGCVVLSGAGPSFCSGGDLDEFGTLPDPASAHAVRATRNAAGLLARCAERAVAHVHGACVGAGAELPAFCRRVVADPGAFFLLPEVGMGLVPGAGGTVSLPRRIGRQRTAWLALTGRRLSAEQAHAWGLVDEIVGATGRGSSARGASGAGRRRGRARASRR
jgi:enoyl-CoA hydratase/carnithine racemase